MMGRHSPWLLYLAIFILLPLVTGFSLVKNYQGVSFFDEWDFYGGYDNLTLGDVWWLDRADAFAQNLAYMNNAGNVILRVDNGSTVPFNQKRNSVRITTQASYGVGSLWIIDLLHLPFGCSVWPAFWTKGPTWPDDGEIDIIEGMNNQFDNQMALHTTPGCVHMTPPGQTGQSGDGDCSQPAGCVVRETQPNSFQAGFAAAGGGVWATQFDVAGIFIWFWSRPNVPASISQASSSEFIDISSWGPPSASYVSNGCNIPQFFTAQNLVLDITLCGDWAGLPQDYLPTCGGSGPTGICYNDNVVGDGHNYDDAYFEVSYVRAYTTPVPTPTVMQQIAASSTTGGGGAMGGVGAPTSTPTAAPTTSTGLPPRASAIVSAARPRVAASWVLAMALAAVGAAGRW